MKETQNLINACKYLRKGANKMLFSVVPRDRKRGKWEYRRFPLNVCKHFCTCPGD